MKRAAKSISDERDEASRQPPNERYVLRLT